jgi:bacteriorhodopsin
VYSSAKLIFYSLSSIKHIAVWQSLFFTKITTACEEKPNELKKLFGTVLVCITIVIVIRILLSKE